MLGRQGLIERATRFGEVKTTPRGRGRTRKPVTDKPRPQESAARGKRVVRQEEPSRKAPELQQTSEEVV
ncbi:hypothetical protein NDU88_004281 [Pleurodeles waltl]|uniref:Uncharacterized protein n=1 Tax=Pleurodeles waltl TaxID=8319 RepID=A0AAV7QHZ1_PLEWA|nr:hypothetical protein NDU88_004281 [Pleurodeles waltl]